MVELVGLEEQHIELARPWACSLAWVTVGAHNFEVVVVGTGSSASPAEGTAA